MYAENELLFPTYVIPKLRYERGEVWRGLVERVSALPEDHPEKLAFSLMMIRIDGCLTCETDSYRAMRGCRDCARQSLRRLKASDEELLALYQKALRDICTHLRIEEPGIPVEESVPARAA